MLNNLLLFLSISTASAEDFTVLAEKQPAPFEGVLLSVPAAAEILAKKEEQEMKCDLEVEFQVDKTNTQCKLDKDLLEARITTLEKEYNEVVAQKDLVIQKQKDIINSQAPQYKWFWFTGGIILGGVGYYGIGQVINVNNP